MSDPGAGKGQGIATFSVNLTKATTEPIRPVDDSYKFRVNSEGPYIQEMYFGLTQPSVTAPVNANVAYTNEAAAPRQMFVLDVDETDSDVFYAKITFSQDVVLDPTAKVMKGSPLAADFLTQADLADAKIVRQIFGLHINKYDLANAADPFVLPNYAGASPVRAISRQDYTVHYDVYKIESYEDLPLNPGVILQKRN